MDNVRATGLVADVEREEWERAARVAHRHTSEDASWGVVILRCYELTDDCQRYVHVPVDRALWDAADEGLREYMRAQARHEFGDPAATVIVVEEADADR